MKLFTARQLAQLLENGKRNAECIAKNGNTVDFPPVVKLFTPDANCTWLLTEIDPDDTDIAFGLCDLGTGCPELGSVRISELLSVRGLLGLPVERDLHFEAKKPLSAYTDEARRLEQINA